MYYDDDDAPVGLGGRSAAAEEFLQDLPPPKAVPRRKKMPMVPKFEPEKSGQAVEETSPQILPEEPKKPEGIVPKVDLDFINKLYSKKIEPQKQPEQPKAKSNYVKPSYKVKDEYDPARPNDYEQIMQNKEREEKEKEMKKQFMMPEENEQQPIVSEEVEEEVTMEEKVMKMLEKQGWKMGEGLGKHGQGMTTPLIAKKTSGNTAVIVNSVMDVSSVLPQEVAERKAREALYNMPPTKVIVLLNMVGPDELDDDLEGEVTDECNVYGKVLSCHVVELKNVPEEEAIRIFVEFETTEEAVTAFSYIYGRFFGGRTVVV